MKKIIYYICFILLLFLISIIPTSAKENKTCVRTESNLRVRDNFIHDNLSDILSTPCIDEVEKVYDFADLLTDSEETLLYNTIKNYITKTKYDLAVVTTDDNPKMDAKSYADDFYDYNYFGLNDTRDGVLLLIDMQTRQMYISTTGYAIKMYDDARIENILDKGYNYITNEDYYNTFNSMINSLDNYYITGYPSSNENLLIDENGHPYYLKYMPYGLIILIAFVITLIVSLILYFKSRLKIKVPETISYMDNNKININKRKDNLVNTVVTHTLRSTSSSSGSSSGSGGSSFHSSSSGSSHGGGGRSF